MFRNWIWWLIGICLILLMPIIPYEQEMQDGVVEIKNQSISSYLYERYKTVQKQTEEKKAETVTVP